ncbi:dehydrogenase/reductase SDR family member 7-like [Ptychodera flava]|uniref:dehydrogenase/reductase SDR family member 7-like n=1 Tax=Ptychodera flava TaxID=63121 RepID=UPI00396A5E34
MVWMTLIGWLVVVVPVIVVFAIFLSDADLTFRFYEHFGVQNGENLKGKVIWITGASSGIGEELAYQLSGIGSKLVLSARRTSELERVKKTCLQRGIVEAEDIMILPLDLCAFDSHDSATQKVLDKFGQVDVLVNNAGRSQRSYALDASLEVDKECLRLNVIGTVSLTKSVLPVMVERKSGHVVVISSVAGKLPAPLQASYSAAKFALQGYFDALRSEVYDENITVTTICPGPVVSKVRDNTMTTTLERTGEDTEYDDPAVHYGNRMATGRCGQIIVTSIANRLNEVWCSRNPFLLFTYIAQYMPSVCRLFSKFYGRQRIKVIRKHVQEKKTK